VLPPPNYLTRNKYSTHHPTGIFLKPTLHPQTNTATDTRQHPPPNRTISPSLFQPPPSSSYLAFRTQYHKPSLSTNIRQHHFPSKTTLNSFILLTPDPPSSFGKQTVSQSTHAIFLTSSPPPQNNYYYH